MNDILKVVEMSEEEQVEFLYIKGYRQIVDTFPAGGLRIKYNKNNEIISVKHSQSKLRFDRRALAYHAFRLRDEAKKEDKYKWRRACYIITHGKLDAYATVGEGHDAEYEVLKREPIVWIITALKAKEKEDE